MNTPLNQEASEPDRDDPVVEFTPEQHPRLFHLTGAGHRPAVFRKPEPPIAYAGSIRLDAPATTDRLMWESLAAPVSGGASAAFPRLSLMVHLSKEPSSSLPSSERAYRALRLLRELRRADSPKFDFLAWLNQEIKESGDSGSIGGAGIQVPWRLAAKAIRAICFGPALRRFKRESTAGGRWDVERVRDLEPTLAELDAARAVDGETEATATALGVLEQIYTRAALADCAEQRIELLIVGTEPGDQALLLVKLLVEAAAGRNTSAIATTYKHDPTGPSLRIPSRSGPSLPRLRASALDLQHWRYLYLFRPRGARWAALLAIGLVTALVLTTVGLWGTRSWPFRCDGPFGAEWFAQCGRIDDGSNCADPIITDVCEAIHRQNEAVGDADYFTVVIALPLDLDGDDPNVPGDLNNQLQGAAAAQALVNAGQSPKMKLLIANAGSGYSEWLEASEAVLERRDDHRIVAVAGLSTSYTDTKSFIDRMTESGLVVMGSTITGNSMLTGIAETNMAFRVAPTNTQEAVALSAFLSERTDLCEVIVVADTDRSYDYATTLEQSFRDRQTAECDTGDGNPDLPRPFTFDGSDIESLNPSVFNQTVRDLCEEIDGDAYLFFAGLSRYALPSLIRSLGGRGSHEGCGDHRITIVTGDNASSIPHNGGVASGLATGDIELYYAGLAHPDQWAGAAEAYAFSGEAMSHAVDQLEDQFGDDIELENGQALMSFEACNAIGLTAQRQGPDVNANLLAAALRDYSAPGLSGPIAFDDQGNPIAKTLVILRATASAERPVEVVALVLGS